MPDTPASSLLSSLRTRLDPSLLGTVERRTRNYLGRPERPPGPPSALMLQSMLGLIANQLDFIEELQRRHGDMAYFRLGRLQFYALHDPELIEQMLLTRHDAFIKDPFARELKELLGEGLLTSEGETWKRNRKLAAPKLKRSQIASYAEVMTRDTVEVSSRAFQQGQQVDLWQVMMDLTLRIVVETLFGLPYARQADQVGHALEQAMQHFDAQQNSVWYFIPRHVPSPRRRAFERSMRALDRTIRDMIRERARRGGPGDDLLWRLIQARDDDGEQMSQTQLRDEALTMFLAGHETTALATTYAFDALARNPEVEARFHEELDALATDRPIGLEDLDALPYTRALIKETLRLYPPAWILSREAIQDVTLTHGDRAWHVPAGSILLSCPYIMHRKEEYFEDALNFDPERWLDGTLEKSLPRSAYMPFGGGPRICIGNHFAMMELILVVANIARDWRFEAIDDAPLSFDPVITLRPSKSVMMTSLRRR